MASLIKNQILKHLSKFAKNLSTDKINVSTLKGEGELTNLELNEDVLTDLLELPLWVRLNKAVCNKVACKIIWTKLKSVPINMYLDEVLVEMETCEELRVQPSSSSMPSYSSGGKYGFSDKVIDGMTVVVNSIVINFKSPAFQASFQLSRLCLDSRTPTWQRSDLRMTRLKEPDRAELLIFKQLEWQTLRIEATAVRLQEQFSTPLRLITNQARCRITIKKRLSDCSILGSRLVLILDDLLWVLTDSQLKAALHFANSLTGLIQQATELAQKTKAARKLESLPGWQTQVTTVAAQSPRQPPASRIQVSAITRVFNLHDVVETSYHFCSGQIDLHLCDEVSPDELRSCHPLLADGGAVQISFHNLAIDYYPYHLASGDRKHWLRYKESSTARSGWVTSLLSDFRQRMTELVQGELPRTHIPVHRTSPFPTGQDNRRTPPSSKATLGVYLARLMSMCLVLRMEDFTIFRVSTSGTRSGTPQKFVGSDKGRLLLPEDLSAIHIEFTQYYYPEDNDIPVPAPNLFAQLNPIRVTFDPLTILWLNAFALNLQRSQVLQQAPDPQKPAVDVRIEALMPRIVFLSEKAHPNQPDWPKQLQLQISRLVVTNSRLGDACGRMELGKCLETLRQGELFFGSAFPSSERDFNPVVEAFVQHSLSQDRQGANGSADDSADGFVPKNKEAHRDGVKDLFDKMHKDLLWTELKNIWCVSMDPVWADFVGAESNRQRPVPFLDAFPLVLWVYQNPLTTKARTKAKRDVYCNGDIFHTPRTWGNEASDPKRSGGSDGESIRPTVANLHILAQIPSLVNVQLDHSQYIFLLRAIEAASELSKQLTLDTSHIQCEPVTAVSSSCYAVFFPELDVSVLMPTGSSGKTADTDENDSLKSGDSFPADLADMANGTRVPLLPNTRSVKESPSSDQLTYKNSGVRMEREESLTGSLTKSCSDSLLDSRSLHNGSPPQNSPLVRSQEVLADTKIMEDDEASIASSLPKFTHGRQGSFSSGEWAHLDKVPDNLTRTLASGSSVVKKGFSSFISSLDSAISSRGNSLHTAAEKRGASPDELQVLEDWETMSIRSDMSSDSDQFLMVHMDSQPSRVEDALFSLKDAGPPKVEMANEMKEDTNSNPSSTSLKRPELMSVCTFRLAKVQYIQQSLGLDSVIRFQCGQLGTEEFGNISWDEFQTKFSAKSRNWQEMSPGQSLTPCELKFRMESGPEAERLCQSAGEVGVLTAIVKDVFLNLLSSNSSGLGDFVQDEIIQPPMPLRIYMHNFSVHIEENRSAITLNSAETSPLDINIAAMTIRREPDGILRFLPVDPDVNNYVTKPFLCCDLLPSEICHLLTTGSVTKSDSQAMTASHSQGESSYTHYVPKMEVFGTSSGESVATLEDKSFDGRDRYVVSPSHSLGRQSQYQHHQHSSPTHASSSMESLIEANEQLKLKLLALDSLEAENEELRAQVALHTCRAQDALKQVDELREEVHHLQEEKRSLLATRQVLQNELVALESRRGSLVNQTSTG